MGAMKAILLVMLMPASSGYLVGLPTARLAALRPNSPTARLAATRATSPCRAGRPCAVIAADAVFGSSLELTDKSGDEVRFILGGTGPELQLFVNGEMFADDIDRVTYEKADRRVKVEGTLSDEEDGETYEVDGDFILPDGPQLVNLATLAILVARAGVEWVGDEPVPLPAELEAKLVDDELKAARPGVSMPGRKVG
eukprot:scaffold216_cov78-Isochrysis_galbana.AAC.5